MFSLYKTLKRLAILSAHPVGEIYMTLDNNFNPQTTWGGVWEKITDRFLVGSGNSYSTGNTGGEATHILTINEMPSHRHKERYGNTPYVDASGEGSSTPGNQPTWAGYVTQRQCLTDYEGGDQPHNNLPPYLAVNIWKRTA